MKQPHSIRPRVETKCPTMSAEHLQCIEKCLTKKNWLFLNDFGNVSTSRTSMQFSKVCECYSVTFLNQTPIFNWCFVR